MLGNVQNFLPKVSLELLNGNNLCACAGMSQLSSRYPVLLYSRKWGFKYPNPHRGCRGGWTRSRELNRLRAPPMRLYGELVSLLLKPEYSRLRQGSVALIVINRNIIRTRLNPYVPEAVE